MQTTVLALLAMWLAFNLAVAVHLVALGYEREARERAERERSHNANHDRDAA